MNPFLGGIYLVGFNFAPSGYATCDGQLMSISTNTALFSLLGTTYGGDGQSTFALPDLRGRVAVHQGHGTGLSDYIIGEVTGTETVTLTTPQIPAHQHLLNVNTAAGNSSTPNGTYLAQGPTTGSGPNATLLKTYTTNAPNFTSGASAIAMAGGGLAHGNLQPLLVVTFIIALQGIFPSRN